MNYQKALIYIQDIMNYSLYIIMVYILCIAFASLVAMLSFVSTLAFASSSTWTLWLMSMSRALPGAFWPILSSPRRMAWIGGIGVALRKCLLALRFAPLNSSLCSAPVRSRLNHWLGPQSRSAPLQQHPQSRSVPLEPDPRRTQRGRLLKPPARSNLDPAPQPLRRRSPQRIEESQVPPAGRLMVPVGHLTQPQVEAAEELPSPWA